MELESKSKLKIYGDRDVFEKRLKEGYEQVAFGRGKLVGKEIISATWVFYNSYKIATYEFPKFVRSKNFLPCKGEPCEKVFLNEEFEEYRKNKKITLTKKMDLGNIIRKWDSYSRLLRLKLVPDKEA
jgi:hypothetical protein